MSEQIIAASMINPNVRTTLLVTGHEPIGMGVETKRLIYADVLGQHAVANAAPVCRSVTLLERTFDEDPPYDTNELFIRNWLAYREAGLFVPRTVRAVDPNRVLVSDVKADGSEVYGKGVSLVLNGSLDGIRYRAHRDIDPLFLDISSRANFGAVETKAEEYEHRANRAGITLARDDPFELIVRPDGSWDIIALDLMRAKLTNPDGRAAIKKSNHERTYFFLKELISIHVKLARNNSQARVAS